MALNNLFFEYNIITPVISCFDEKSVIIYGNKDQRNLLFFLPNL